MSTSTHTSSASHRRARLFDHAKFALSIAGALAVLALFRAAIHF